MSGAEGAGSECPVCYEGLRGPGVSERRLSCGHSFCHDCLVRYLVTGRSDGGAAAARKNIVCPLCRYVTFLTRRGLISPPRSGALSQILEVPCTPPPGDPCTPPPGDPCTPPPGDPCTPPPGDPNTLVIPESGDAPPLPHCTCLGDAGLDHGNYAFESQVFVISERGQRMEAEEADAPTGGRHVDARVSCCRSPSLIMVLLLIFLAAVLAAVLPWILLVKKV